MGSVRQPQRWLAAALAVAAFAGAPARAAANAPGDADDGLAGFISVPWPAVTRTRLSLSAAGGYGYLEAREGEEGAHQRLQGTLAGAFALRDVIAASLRFDGRLDAHPDDGMGTHVGMVGDPILGLRSGVSLTDAFSLGAALNFWAPGSQAPSVELSAATLDAALLFGLSPTPDFHVGLSAGYRLDHSHNSIESPERLRAGDRLVLGVSDFDAARFGLGIAHGIGATEWLLELRSDLLLGDEAPEFGDMPMVAGAGLRHALGEALQLSAHVDVRLSGAAEQQPDDPLVRVLPLVSATLGLRYQLGFDAPPPVDDDYEPATEEPSPAEDPAPEPEPEQKREEPSPEPPPPATVTPGAPTVLRGRVGDEHDVAVHDAKVVWADDEGVQETKTDADGNYRIEFERPPAGPGTVTMTAEGFNELSESVTLGAGEDRRLDLKTHIVVPEGQVRGTIRSRGGKGLKATITIYPQKIRITTNDEGYFESEVEPGSHKVRVRSYGYRSQNRTVVVQDNGVTVLNVELKKK